MSEPSIITLHEQPALVIAAEITASQIAATLSEILPRVHDYATVFGNTVAGVPFTRYLGYTGTGLLRIEAGFPTLESLPPGDEIQSIVLDGGEAISLIHTGPYHHLPAAHATLDQWFESTRRRAAAPRVESFLDGQRTLITQPLAPE